MAEPPAPNDAPAGGGPSSGAGELVRCEVTGRLLPPDETVVFRGRRVGAEGKRALLERLAAGLPMPGEREDGSRWARLGAALLDTLLFLALVLVAVVVYFAFSASSGGGFAAGPRLVPAATVAWTLLAFAYYGALTAARGQTLGKIAAGIRVVDADGSPVRSGQAWGRSAVYTLPALLGDLPGLITGDPDAVLGLELVLGSLLMLWWLVDVLFIFGPERRCLHDHLFRTRVLSARA